LLNIIAFERKRKQNWQNKKNNTNIESYNTHLLEVRQRMILRFPEHLMCFYHQISPSLLRQGKQLLSGILHHPPYFVWKPDEEKKHSVAGTGTGFGVPFLIPPWTLMKECCDGSLQKGFAAVPQTRASCCGSLTDYQSLAVAWGTFLMSQGQTLI